MLVLEEDADLKLMTLAEPLGCILNSMDKSQVQPGQKVLVIGAGPMGLLHIEGLKQRGITDMGVGIHCAFYSPVGTEMISVWHRLCWSLLL